MMTPSSVSRYDPGAPPGPPITDAERVLTSGRECSTNASLTLSVFDFFSWRMEDPDSQRGRRDQWPLGPLDISRCKGEERLKSHQFGEAGFMKNLVV